ncbi:MAG TPA: HNH endonuclease [bacterium]|nr:HNH endonuclease [bacterium]
MVERTKKQKEHTVKMGKENRGKVRSKEVREKNRKARLGKKHSKEAKGKISKNNSKFWTGKKRPEISGKKCHLWRGGVSSNKEYRSWVKNRRNKLKRKAEGSHTFGEWELLKRQYGYRCVCCGKGEVEVKLTEDHIIPLSKGGSDYIENIQPLCQSCNSIKRTKIIKFK